MTEEMVHDLEKEVVYECHAAKKDLDRYIVMAQVMAEKLLRVGRGLQDHPELVNGTPSLGNASTDLDYRPALNAFPTREEVVGCGSKIAELREKLRKAESKLSRLV